MTELTKVDSMSEHLNKIKADAGIDTLRKSLDKACRNIIHKLEYSIRDIKIIRDEIIHFSYDPAEEIHQAKISELIPPDNENGSDGLKEEAIAEEDRMADWMHQQLTEKYG